MEKFKTITEKVEAQIIEKKSKFIANIFSVDNVEQANKIVKQVKKQYYDAKHNCFAYSIYSENSIITKCSDDGEPSKTAGAPILNIIEQNNLSNIIVIVTRYFGGVLLGTGGLVRAYSSATEQALKKAQYKEQTEGYQVELEIDYSEFEKVKYYLLQNNINTIKTEYLKNIKIIVEITEQQLEKITKNNSNKTINIIKIDKKHKKVIDI